MDEQDVVRSLAALAQPHRLRAFRALVVAGPGGLTPGVMAEQLDIPANTLSFHLKELVQAALLTVERDGRYLVYRVDFERTRTLIDFLTENCCAGQPCATDTPPGAACAC